MLGFDQSTALITGASSGIGEALAYALADRGLDLVITARRAERLAAIKENLEGRVKVVTIPCDLTATGGLEHLIKTLDEADTPIDMLVNCAGLAPHIDFLNADDSSQQDLIALNVTAPTRLISHLLPPMRARGFGSVLNVCSVAAFHPVPSMAQYGASKAYLLSLTEALSEELKGTGVTFCALCPGVTKTESAITEIVEALPEAMVLAPAAVAEAGLNALDFGEVVCVPGRLNQAAVTAAQFQPRWLVRSLGGLIAKFRTESVATPSHRKEPAKQ
jgi:short-subunit dehydrogenase